MVAHPIQDHEGHELIPGTSEDRDLTLAFQRGEKGAYQAIHERYATRVQSVCRRILINPDDAAEASQESFLRVYQALGRFNGRYQLGAWITRVTTNVCLDQLRARNRRGGEYCALELEDLEGPAPADGYPEEVVIRRSEGRRVRKVLDSLPPMHRAAIALRDFEGLSYEEVALALGITDSQVKALLHRARQRFKKAWLSEVASIFVPWRLVDRIRGTDLAARETTATQALTSAVNSAPACTSMLQQCGHYVAERVAPVFTALVVGGATGGALLTPSTPAHSTPQVESSNTTVSADVLLTRGSDNDTRQLEPKKRTRKPAMSVEPESPVAPEPADEVPAEEPTTPPAEEEPAASPSPQPTEGGDGTDTSSGGSQGGDTTLPMLDLAVGFKREGATVPYSRQVDPTEDVNCSAPSFEQHLQTAIWDGDESYPASISTYLTPNGMTIYTTITKGDYVVTYPGTAYVKSSVRSGDQLRLELKGTYGTHHEADAAGLPHSGSLDVSLKLDCLGTSVVHEALIFGTMPDNS